MQEFKLNTPVAFIIFNRPDTTARVFAEIAKAKPPKLLVVADGARANKQGEAEKVAATRAIIDKVDWPCEVLINYSDINLGCKNRVSSGIDWVFEQVPEAIILEDDCLPDPSFFRFCEEMLVKYRDDQRIGMISGDNFQFGCKRGEASYYFSRFTHIWGWASWRRAWQFSDKNIAIWIEFRDNYWQLSSVSSKAEFDYWTKTFQTVYDSKIDTCWDYQWTLVNWSQSMMTILPNTNLISNIGFGADATHTHGASIYANLKTTAIDFPLIHPKAVISHHKADAFTAKGMFTTSLTSKLINKLKAFVN